MEFTKENVIKEFEELTGEKVEKIKVNFDWSVKYFEIETEDKEYIVLKNEEEAEELAKERVTEDFINEPELFNKDWLETEIRNLRKEDFEDNESVADVIGRKAVEIDGYAHFLAYYDGSSEFTKSGFVVMRIN